MSGEEGAVWVQPTTSCQIEEGETDFLWPECKVAQETPAHSVSTGLLVLARVTWESTWGPS